MAEQYQHRLLVLFTGLGEDLLPGLLGIGQHHGHEFGQLLLLGGEAGGLLRHGATQLQQIDTQHARAEEGHHTDHQHHTPALAAQQPGQHPHQQ